MNTFFCNTQTGFLIVFLTDLLALLTIVNVYPGRYKFRFTAPFALTGEPFKRTVVAWITSQLNTP